MGCVGCTGLVGCESELDFEDVAGSGEDATDAVAVSLGSSS